MIIVQGYKSKLVFDGHCVESRKSLAGLCPRVTNEKGYCKLLKSNNK